MYPFKKILCPTDYSLCAEVALRKALPLAQRYQAEVHLLHVAPEVSGNGAALPNGHSLSTWFTRTLDERADPDAERWRGLTLRRTVVRHADPVAAILDYVREHGIDLVIMGTHGDSVAYRFLSRGGGGLLGHTAEQVVRHAPCPVLTAGLCHSQQAAQVRHLLVPLDFSSQSMLALTVARDLAALYDASLVVLSVIEQRHVLNEAGIDQAELETDLRAELVDAYEQTRGPQVSARFHAEVGRPDQVIRRFVRQYSIDLVVQGAHSDARGEALGDIAEGVVRTVLCPVLTVRGVEDRVVTRPVRLPAASR